MLPITQISKPSLRALSPQFADPWITVRDRRRSTRNTRPILVPSAILESNLNLLASIQILKLLAVVICKEQKVRTAALCDCHGPGDHADVRTLRRQHCDLELAGHVVEFLELLVHGCVMVVLLCDGWVGLRGDLGLLEFFGHLDGWSGAESCWTLCEDA